MQATKLTFVKSLGVNNYHQRVSLWRCECGREKAIIHSRAVRGATKSCGCLQREALAKTVAIYRRKPYGESCFNSLFGLYRAGAKRRGFCFDLTPNEFAKLVAQPCFYCGCQPSSKHRRSSCYGEFVYSGIDRVKNTVGYTLENCVPCCQICNNAKRTLSLVEFVEWITRIHRHINRSGVLEKLKHLTTT